MPTPKAKPDLPTDKRPEPSEPSSEEKAPDSSLNNEEARKLGSVQDMLRRAMVAGLGAVFMTEEGIRTLVKDKKLPKDVVGYFTSQAERSKDELFRIIGQELHELFESAALRRELVRLLSTMTIEVKAQIRLRPDGGPEVKVETTKASRNEKEP